MPRQRKRSLSKAFIIPPPWRGMRVPGQVPGRQGPTFLLQPDPEMREVRRMMTEKPQPATLAKLFEKPMVRPAAIVEGLGLSLQEAASWGRFLDEVCATSGNPLILRQRVLERARESGLPPEVRKAIMERAAAYWNQHMAKSVLVYSPDDLQKAKKAKGGNYYRRVVQPDGKVKYFQTEEEYKAWPGAHLSGHEVAVEHAKHAIQGLVERSGPEGVGHEHLVEVAKKHGGEATAAAVKHGLHEGGHYVWDNGRLHRRDASHDLMHKLYGGEGEAAAEPAEEVQKAQAGPFIGPKGGKWADAAHTVAWHEPGTGETQATGRVGGLDLGPVMAGNMGIPRQEMPQIKSTKVRDFLEGLKGKGIKTEHGEEEVGRLRATQSGVHASKVLDLMKPELMEHLQKPVLVSNDGYILDGHHRWAALRAMNPKHKIGTVKVDLPMHELLRHAHSYQGVEYKKAQANGDPAFYLLEKAEGAPTPTPAAPKFTIPGQSQQPGHTPRQVTPIGGITPGGYKRVAADVYVPVGQEARQPGQPEQPGQQGPQLMQQQPNETPAQRGYREAENWARQQPVRPTGFDRRKMAFTLQAQYAGQGQGGQAAPAAQPTQPPIAQQAPAAAAPAPVQAPVHQQPTQVQGTGKRKWIDHLEGMPKDTQKHWMDPAAGDYKPERKKLHDQIVAKFLEGKQAPPPGQKVAVVMMGGTASGKTTLAKNFLGDKFDQFANVNPDDVKEHLPEYQKGVAASAKDAAFSTHEESADVSERVLQEGIAKGLNLLVDGTGKTAHKHIKRVQDLQAKGYQVHLLMPDVDPEEAVRRSNARAEATGRYVPTGEPPPGHPDIVRPMYQAIPKNFETIARHADQFVLYDTRQGSPRPVWSGKKGAQDTVHDPQFVSWFKQQHGQAQQQAPAATAMQQGGQPAMMKSETGKPAPQPQAQPAQPAPMGQPFISIEEGMANTAKAKPEDWKEEWEGKPAEHAPGEGAVWPVDDVDYDLDSKVPQSIRKQQANGGAQPGEGEQDQAKPKFTIKDKGRGEE